MPLDVRTLKTTGAAEARLRSGRVLNLRDPDTWGHVTDEELLYNCIRTASVTPVEPMSSKHFYAFGQRILIGSYLAEDFSGERAALAWIVSNIASLVMGGLNDHLINTIPSLSKIREAITEKLADRLNLHAHEVIDNDTITQVRDQMEAIEVRDIRPNTTIDTSELPKADPDVIIARMLPYEIVPLLAMRINVLCKDIGLSLRLDEEFDEAGEPIYKPDPRVSECMTMKAMSLCAC